MKSISDWARENDVNDRAWLILGKGPSYAAAAGMDLSGFRMMSLNHVVRERSVELAHIIDIDVVGECADAIESNAGYLVMPWHPHSSNRARRRTLESYIPKYPVLGRLAAGGRLLTYNLSTGAAFERLAGAPEIKVRFFSAEAALNVLVAMGVRTVRSLGIDGGNTYAEDFSDISGKTLLANGRESFDCQFKTIAETLRHSGISYAPLGVEVPVRVFIGADSSQALAARVLEYSIKRHASLSVELAVIDNGDLLVPEKASSRARTGFSFARFRIPGLCGHRGRAIYMDADMLVFADIFRLWSLPFGGADLLYANQPSKRGRIPQYSVMVMDCQRLHWDAHAIIAGLCRGDYDYEQLMYQFAFPGAGLRAPGVPSEWNMLEDYQQGRTSLLHYTDMPRQPWISDTNPNRELWLASLRDALEERFICEDFLAAEIEAGNVSPALPSWLRFATSGSAQYGDWVPPYLRKGRIGWAGSSVLRSLVRLRTGVRRLLP